MAEVRVKVCDFCGRSDVETFRGYILLRDRKGKSAANDVVGDVCMDCYRLLVDAINAMKGTVEDGNFVRSELMDIIERRLRP